MLEAKVEMTGDTFSCIFFDILNEVTQNAFFLVFSLFNII